MSHINRWEEQGLYRKYIGVVSGEEILESNLKLHEHPDFANIKYVINDFTEMIEHSITIAHTDIYAKTDEIASNTKGKLKIAIVVVNTEHYDLAVHYKQMMQGKLFECEIYNLLEDARQWVCD